MAGARKLHPHAGMSMKVSALSDFEFRVWTQYILSADDFGVMPATAFVLQADNAALANRPTRKVQAALETVISVGLVFVFTHQGTRYMWQKDWQDWQEIRWPRKTSRPLPTVQIDATPATLRLFGEHVKKVTHNFGETSEELTSRARARNPHPNQNTNPNSNSSEESARETTPPNWKLGGPHQRVSPLTGGDHLGCDPVTSLACARGVCVPPKMAIRWRQQLEHAGFSAPALDGELRAVVADELARHNGYVIGDDPWKFWQAAWTAKYGSRAPQVQNAAAHSLEAARTFKQAVDAEAETFIDVPKLEDKK